MFDGFKSEHGYLMPWQWREIPALSFAQMVEERTGLALDGKQTAKHKGLVFRIIPSKRFATGYSCQVGGSLHQYFNQGKGNANDFGLADVQEVLHELEDRFSLELESSILRGIEYGVNIEPPIPVRKLLRSIIAHNNRRFEQMDLQRQWLGVECERSEYRIKIYDKKRQQKREGKELLRVEIKVFKMRYLNRFGIKTLADLIDPQKVAMLGNHLLKTFQGIVFYERGIDESELSPSQLLKFKDWQNPMYWEDLSRKERGREKERFRQLIDRFSKSNTKKEIENRISEKWEYLSKVKRKNWVRFHQVWEEVEAEDLGTFSPLEYMGKTSLRPSSDPTRFSEGESQPKTPDNFPQRRQAQIQKRECVSCGRTISHQKKGSLFCGEKYRGKAAKTCRNQDSNRRRTLTKRMMKAKANEQWLQISYWWEGELHSDTLYASELEVSRELLNQIEKVEILSETPTKYLEGEAARQLVANLVQSANNQPKKTQKRPLGNKQAEN
ncbi:MAG: hypothetical protein AAF399_00225 [Bacteroidota bacterium]